MEKLCHAGVDSILVKTAAPSRPRRLQGGVASERLGLAASSSEGGRA